MLETAQYTVRSKLLLDQIELNTHYINSNFAELQDKQRAQFADLGGKLDMIADVLGEIAQALSKSGHTQDQLLKFVKSIDSSVPTMHTMPVTGALLVFNENPVLGATLAQAPSSPDDDWTQLDPGETADGGSQPSD